MDPGDSQSNLFSQKIRKIDIFKKVPRDFSEGTNTGGCVSIITGILIIYFLLSEVRLFLEPPLSTTLHFANDKLSRKQMKINIDIEFPKFPCELLSLDIQDQMLSHHPNIASVKKWRLDRNGKYLDRKDFELLHQPDPFKQMDMTETAIKNGYGCRMVGGFTVKEVPGNFHISSHAYQANYVRLMMQGLLKKTDISHIIHKLEVGDADVSKLQKIHPGAQLMRLNGHKRTYSGQQQKHSYLSHYHLSIVPTIYTGVIYNTQTYQYTWNHNSWAIDQMPSVYFVYEIEGSAVEVSPKNWSLTGMILNLCFIIGGVYAIGNFLDQFLFKAFGDKLGYQALP